MEIKDKDTLLKLIAEKADDAAAFSGGAQVVSIEDVYELLSPNSFENLARKYSHYYNDTWHFSDEFLKQFAEALLEDKEREITELKANNNQLREALEVCKYECHTGEVIGIAQQALLKTPAQSLQSVINETIEECAKVCEEIVIENPGRADLTVDQCAKTIRALKVSND